MNNKKTLLTTSIAGLIALSGFSATAAELSIKITNLTHGIAFTPFLVAGHDSDTHLFQSGTAASVALEAMAEGGDISGLSSQVDAAGGYKVENPAAGLLMAGASTDWFDLDTKTGTHLSLTAMLLPTNDGFAGVDGWKIPTTAGTYTILVNAYDAGTEANDELTASIPQAIPTNSGGTGLSAVETNMSVHIHPGNVGDDSVSDGKSDLTNTVHRWLNPVLKVTVTVK